MRIGLSPIATPEKAETAPPISDDMEGESKAIDGESVQAQACRASGKLKFPRCAVALCANLNLFYYRADNLRSARSREIRGGSDRRVLA